jgi:hypothetical protein
MKARTLKELFILMKNEKSLSHHYGICNVVNQLYWHHNLINKREHVKLHQYIRHNRPKKNSIHYRSTRKNTNYYWKIGAWTPRLAWINDQIKLLSKE